MNIITKAYLLAGAYIRKALSIVFPSRTNWKWSASGYSYAGQVGDGRQSSILVACVRWLQRTFPEAPVVLEKAGKGGEWDRQQAHPFLDLLDMPNKYYDGLLLQAATLADWMFTGNAYWIKVRSGTGRVVELWWAPSSLVEPRWVGDEFISYYEYSPKGTPIRYANEDVVHFRNGLDPQNTRKGLSDLASLFREIYTDEEAANMTAALMRNMGVPGVIISPTDSSASVDPDSAEATKRKFQEGFTGDKRGEPLVMTGPTKVDVFGFSPQQMDLKALRRIPEERISAVTGIPAVVVGLGAGLDRSTYANYAEARLAAYEGTVIPLQRIFSSVLKRQLLEDFEDDMAQWRVIYDLSDIRILQDDENKIAERVVRLVQGGILTVAQGQRLVGEIPDPSQNIYLRSALYTEVPAGAAQKALPAPEIKIKAARLTNLQRTLMLALRHDEEQLDAAFNKRLTGLFSSLGQQARAIYESLTGGKALKEDDDALVRQMLIRLGLDKFVDDKLSPAYKAQYLLTAETVFGTVSRVMDMQIFLEDSVASRILEIGGKRVGLLDVSGDSKDAMFRAIQEGRDAGESTREIAKRIQEHVGGGTWKDAATRATVISRTETKFAMSTSSLEAYETSGVVRNVTILDAQLGPTDEECEALNGETVDFAEAQNLMAAEHPNGTRAVVPNI